MATTTTSAESVQANAALTALKTLGITDGVITSVEHDVSPTLTTPDGHVIASHLPPRTIVKIVLTPAKGSHINVEICLPEPGKWNARFVGVGNGGSAGNINPGFFAGPVSHGYAVASTDMGTAPNADSGIGNPDVWKDFGFRATHLMTAVSRQVIKTCYGKAPEYSYFIGGSTGGQQALQEAQRYPDDYDGIVAQVPAHCRTPLHAYFLWNYQILHECPFTESQQKNIIAAGNQYVAPRESPVTAGKLVSDPRCDAKDIEAVIVLALKKDSTLTPKHAAALRKLFDGPRRADTGERIFCGIPFGASFDMAHRNLYLFKWVFGENKDLLKINFGKDIDTYTAALGPYLNAENPDLGAFEKHGGKLIMMSGSADDCVPYTATLDYYERVIGHFGSLEKVRSFFRYYLIPGMDHGSGGPGVNSLPDLLSLVVDWREKGAAPDLLRGKRIVDGKVEMDLPIYPYPTKAVWDAATSGFKPAEGQRGGVDRVAERFRPPAAE